MLSICNGRTLLAIVLGASLAAWGQGGNGRAGRAAAQQAPTPGSAPAGATGRGGAATEFFNFDSTAVSGPSIPESPPAETHRKITISFPS